MTLVYFIGGITYTELAALRWMSRQEGKSMYLYLFICSGQYGDIIVATTNFVNGDNFFTNVF